MDIKIYVIFLLVYEGTGKNVQKQAKNGACDCNGPQAGKACVARAISMHLLRHQEKVF
jgi:hypothetical protein